MKFAGTIKSDPNWFVLLTDVDGNPHLIAVIRWGIFLEDNSFSISSTLHPLDEMGEDFMLKDNFVTIINPNRPLTKEAQIELCALRLKEMRRG